MSFKEEILTFQLESAFYIVGSISTAHEENGSVKNVCGCFQSKAPLRFYLLKCGGRVLNLFC